VHERNSHHPLPETCEIWRYGWARGNALLGKKAIRAHRGRRCGPRRGWLARTCRSSSDARRRKRRRHRRRVPVGVRARTHQRGLQPTEKVGRGRARRRRNSHGCGSGKDGRLSASTRIGFCGRARHKLGSNERGTIEAATRIHKCALTDDNECGGRASKVPRPDRLEGPTLSGPPESDVKAANPN